MKRLIFIFMLMICANFTFASCPNAYETSENFRLALVKRTKSLVISKYKFSMVKKVEDLDIAAAFTHNHRGDFVVLYNAYRYDDKAFLGSVSFDKDTCKVISDTNLVEMTAEKFDYN